MSADELRRAAAEYDTALTTVGRPGRHGRRHGGGARDRAAVLGKELGRLRPVVETERGHLERLKAKTAIQLDALEKARASKSRAVSMAFRSSRAGAEAAAAEASPYNRARRDEERCAKRLADLEAELDTVRTESVSLAPAAGRHTSAVRDLGMLYARVFDNQQGIPSGASGVDNQTLDDAGKLEQASELVREAASVLLAAMTPLRQAENDIGYVFGTNPTSMGTRFPTGTTQSRLPGHSTRLGNRRFQRVMANAQREADRARRLTEQAARLNPTLFATGVKVDPMPDEDPEYPRESSDYLHVRRIRSALDSIKTEESRVRMELVARAGRDADRVAGERGRAVRQRDRQKDSLEERRRAIMRAAGAGAGGGAVMPTAQRGGMNDKTHPVDVLLSNGAEAPPPAYMP